jgi:nucleotidyltransferase substrate binding protein (TIGR01987 family)
MPVDPDVRWKQRFQSFERAFSLLREALDRGPAALNQLEREGTIQRFEFCLELAWKTAKDYLEYSGVVIQPSTPRQVVKEAYAAGMLSDGQVWVDMLDHRNLLSHTYDAAVFDDAIQALVARYRPALEELQGFLLLHRTNENPATESR